MNKLIVEFIGTFFLCLTAAVTGNPIAVGAVLVALIFAGAHVSGAHYNPAVTLGLTLRGKCEVREALAYIIIQICAAFIAAWVSFVLISRTSAPAPGTELWKALLAEFIFTFALVFVVLHVATSKKLEGNGFYALAIGFTVMAGAFACGQISGGVFNPALTIGMVLVDLLKGGNSSQTLSYLLPQFLGGAVAAVTYKMTVRE